MTDQSTKITLIDDVQSTGRTNTDRSSIDTDQAVHVHPDGVAQAGKATDFFCPICLEVRLEVGTLHGTEVCCCPACQGFVVDSATFGALIENLRAEYCGPDDRPVPMNPADLELSILCPACFSPMYTHPYYGPGNEIINSCSGCQINWLDAGELTKIIRAPGRRRR